VNSGGTNLQREITLNTNSDLLQFSRIGTAHVSIDSSGRVMIGASTYSAAPNAGVNFSPAGSANIGNTAQATGWGFLIFSRSGTQIGGIVQNGTAAVAYNTTSDRRLKENITNTRGGLSKLMGINVHDFNFITDPSKTTVQGFIAQELYKVYPEAVTPGGADPHAKPWAVEYGRLTPLLVKSVQELKAENDNLKAANDNQEEAIKKLETRLRALEAGGARR
jgi:hypothetical protein